MLSAGAWFEEFLPILGKYRKSSQNGVDFFFLIMLGGGEGEGHSRVFEKKKKNHFSLLNIE